MVYFDQIYIAGEHQWKRLKERSKEDDIYDLIKRGVLVFNKGDNKYFKYDDCIIPTSRSKIYSNVNVIRTVLHESMEVREL